MKKTNFASVIILTWNGLDFVEGCLNSVLAQTYPEFEVIVVDNASTDGTSDLVAQRFPSVRLIRNEHNLGFAGGVNVGISSAAGEFLVLLNQDTLVDPNWLEELITGMLKDEKVGIGGCKIFDWSGGKIWHTGILLNEDNSFPDLRGAGEIDNGQYDDEEEMVGVAGTAFAVRRKLLDEIGLLDEDYFFYMEDLDYCFRARNAGYKVMYYPRSILRHYVGSSLKVDSYQISYYFHISRILFLLKNYDHDWLTLQLEAAEERVFQRGLSVNVIRALHYAYIYSIYKIVGRDPAYLNNLEEGSIQRLLGILVNLGNSILEPFHREDGAMPPGLFDIDIQERYQLKPFEFRSDTPIVGKITTTFRRIWSSIAGKWIERNLIQRQNGINYQLALQLAKQTQLNSVLISYIDLVNQRVIELTNLYNNPTEKTEDLPKPDQN